MISENEIEHLAELARIEVSPEQKKKLARDLEEILAHVKELSEVTTNSVEPMTGSSAQLTTSGTQNRNGFRDDELKHSDFKTEKSTEAFPEKEGGFLKIPPVFE
ncbi:MAG: Asp-tRNA(Asn)/Glu-tRNA(Gln) amidotransferase subunit GatC [Candidatus Jorgensenbacteria bacterium]|nr:Asp-tRNA(Asn)/Glu-tRNA(Gln) amidotransferase subunit GatC [Candidatus Jorgensenbacteria bacterium]